MAKKTKQEHIAEISLNLERQAEDVARRRKQAEEIYNKEIERCDEELEIINVQLEGLGKVK